MITKQQALEFIYELSKKHQVCLDLKHCIFGLNPFCNGDELPDYEYSVNVHSCVLTDIVKEFILKYPEIADEIKLIPVDINMLEIGQTYKVHIQEDWEHRYFTAKFLGFDEEDEYVVKFENNKPCTKFDFREIYKVNE